MAFVFESWLQFQERTIKEVAAECQCSREDAADCVTYLSQYAIDWWNLSCEAIKAGETPPQWWVNQQSGKGEYTRWEQWLKHHPSAMERLHKTGLSLMYTKSSAPSWGR